MPDPRPMHPTLARQLRRLGLDDSAPPPSAAVWSQFLARVDAAYTDADNDRYTAERAMAVSSAELAELNDSLRRENESLVEGKLQLLLESTGEGIYGIDPDGHCTFVNRAAVQLLGFSRDEMLGRNMHDLIHHHRADGSAYPVEECPIYQARFTGTPCRIDTEILFRKDGSSFAADFAAFPIHDGQSTGWAGMVVTFTDVTLRKTAESQLALAAAEMARGGQLLRSLIDSSPDLIFYKGPDAVYLGCNKAFAAYVGRAVEQVAGLTDDDLFPPDVAAGRRAAVAELMRTKQATQFEELLTYPDGRQVPADTVRTPLLGPTGELLGVLGMSRNITDRKAVERQTREAHEAAQRARAAAEAASAAKSEFLANMSHEIRTPLNGVIGMAELLLGTTLSEQQARFTKVLRTSADALLGVINQVLDFSKIEAGKLELEQTPFDLAPVVHGVVEMMAHRAAAKGLTLTAELAPDVPRSVTGDPVRLRQILVNLVNNAVKFTESGRVAIRVTTAPANGCNAELRFEVADTGPGIPPDRIGRLFKSFSQIDASTTRRHGGTGLGLAISARLATLMGGRTGVDSTVGVGSTFWFTVTVEAAGESAGTDRSDPTEPATIARAGAVAGELPPGLRVLVAEDNEVNQEVVAHLLARMGCLATVVGDGQAAVDVMSANPDGFDLVLMDCQMPVLDGFAAATEIRRWEAMGGRTRSLPILALTASAIVGDRDRCLAAGMDGYVTKPIQPLELRDALITLVRPKRTAAAA